MKFFQSLRKRSTRRQPGSPTVVKFAGGMGTQIIQAAVYFALREDGESALADLRYFDTASKMAVVGDKGKATHWFWQLDQYGLMRDTFETIENKDLSNHYMLSDGPEMMEFGLQALQRPEIQRHFLPADISAFNIPIDISTPFLCLHVRRGDYVNVASHLVSDDEFLQLARKFSGLVQHAVLLSDSPFEDGFRNKMSQLFGSVSYLDNLDPYSSHWLMRKAQVLVCSNSTYSLTAAMLNTAGLIVMPKQWFGPDDHAIEVPIQALCNFQIMS